MTAIISYSLPVCVTCERRADAKCRSCQDNICLRHSYDGLCMTCETIRQTEEYGVQLHGTAGTKHLGGA